MKIKTNQNSVAAGVMEMLRRIEIWPEVEEINISGIMSESGSDNPAVEISYWTDNGLRCLVTTSGGTQEIFIDMPRCDRAKIQKRLEALSPAPAHC